MQQFKIHVQDKIKELESMPYHGQEFPESPDDVERVPVFDESEFLGYCSDIVREAYVQAAAFGLDKDPPTTLMNRDDALFYMRQVLACVDQHHIREADFLTVDQAAERLQVSSDSIYDLVKQGSLEHTNVGRSIRIKPSALEHLRQDDGW